MSANWKDNNYYEILEIPPNASPREVHDSFKRAKITYAGDNPALYSMFTKEEARELMRLIDEAYHVLSNPRLREEYDQQLMRQNSKQPEFMNNKMPSEGFIVPEAEVIPFNPADSETGSGEWVSQEAAIRDEGSGQVKVKVRPQPTSGMAQTKFGTYEIDPEFEQVIRARTDFDGPFLQKVRVYKKLSLDNLSAMTRVSRTYLTAVENMDTAALPAPVFVRGFVSHFARALGLNEKQVADSYMKFLKDKIS